MVGSRLNQEDSPEPLWMAKADSVQCPQMLMQADSRQLPGFTRKPKESRFGRETGCLAVAALVSSGVVSDSCQNALGGSALMPQAELSNSEHSHLSKLAS